MTWERMKVNDAFIMVVVVQAALLLTTTCTADTLTVTVTTFGLPGDTINIDVVRSSAVQVRFIAGATWNTTCLYNAMLSNSAEMFSVSPQSLRYGFSVTTMFPSLSWQNASSASSAVLRVSSTVSTSLFMTFGPAPNYFPESFFETLTINFPPTCFLVAQNQNTTVATVDVTPVSIEFSRPNDRETTKSVTLVTSCVLAAAAVMSGSSGWIGLSSLQSYILSFNHSLCAETYLNNYLQTPSEIVSVPLYRAPSSTSNTPLEAQVFGSNVAVCIGALLVHALLVSIVKRCFEGYRRHAWRTVAKRLYFPAPFFFTVVYLWLGLTVTAYSGIVNGSSSSSASSPSSTPTSTADSVATQTPSPLTLASMSSVVSSASGTSMVVAWVVMVGIISIIWWDGLKRGFDGHYALYQWSASSAAADVGGEDSLFWRFVSVTGSYRHWFLPLGKWTTSGYGVIRANCHFRAYTFGIFTLMAVGVSGALTVNRSSCDAYFGSMLGVELLYLVVFLIMRPFTVPFLNLVWLGIKLNLFVLIGLQYYWIHHSTVPNSASAISIRLAGTAMLGLHGIFIFYQLIITSAERSARSKRRLREALNRIGDSVDVSGVGQQASGSAMARIGGRIAMALAGRRNRKRNDEADAGSWSMPLLQHDAISPTKNSSAYDDGLLTFAVHADDEGASGRGLLLHAEGHQRSQQTSDWPLSDFPMFPRVTQLQQEESTSSISQDLLSSARSVVASLRAKEPVPISNDIPGDLELEGMLMEMSLRLGPCNKAVGGGDGWQNGQRRGQLLADAHSDARHTLEEFWGAAETQMQQSKAILADSKHVLASWAKPPPASAVVLVQPALIAGVTSDEFAFIVEAASSPGAVKELSVTEGVMKIVMKSIRDAEAAVHALNSREILGVTLKVTIAKSEA